jgi:cellobiose transport system permease protein
MTALDAGTTPPAGPNAGPPPGPPAGGGRRREWGRRPGERRTGDRPAVLGLLDARVSPYAYVAPFFVLFGIFGAYPMAYTVWVSLTDRSPQRAATGFVGLDNYAVLMGDDRFWTSVVNTLGMFVISTVPQLLMALVLASWLNRRIRAIGFFRMAVAVPVVTSTAVVALIFGMFYARDYGLLNYLLETVGVDRIDWRAERFHSWVAIATMVDWRWTGYNALIYLAAMQAIPKDLYESAELDGASRTRQLWSITVPMLKPTIIFTAVISTIGGLQLFVEPVMFTTGSDGLRGGTTGQFQTMNMYLVQTLRSFHEWGRAGAIALLLIVLTVLVSVVNYLLIRRIGSEG